MNKNNIRNFCIIAHIDHGKSTMADRMLELTNTVDKRDMKEQVLDQMDLERERGITIKLTPVRMKWTPRNLKSQETSNKQKTNSNSQTPKLEIRNSDLEIANSEYTLNLIDTPGHVDFSYEVSRSLAAVEGAILLVDASQGIEAQTLSTLYAALEHDLEIIPVLNKIDLPAARVDEVSKEITKLLGCKKEDILLASAKTGEGAEKILDKIIEIVPPPKAEEGDELKALIFDSVYDNYRGVVAYFRVSKGSIKNGDEIQLMQTKSSSRVEEIGIFSPDYVPHSPLSAGEIGYAITGFKQVSEARVGDTITLKKNPANSPLAGYEKVKPFVFASIFCTESDRYPDLKEAIEKLKLNDAALEYEPERSDMLGQGFRCGFLGLLHLDIIRERLEREFDLDLVVTTPSVVYKLIMQSGEEKTVEKISELPDAGRYESILEPWSSLEVITNKEYVGSIMELCQKKRAIYKNTDYLDERRVVLSYEIPMAEIITDFYDQLKSISSGYASMNYDYLNYRAGDLVKLDILVAEEKVEAMSTILYRPSSQAIARKITSKLKDLIPRQNFEIKIQAAIGSSIIASERLSAMRKDVTAGLYGGDVTRKNKLLDKQRKGKKKMKQMGKVNIPSDVFIKIMQ